MSKISVAQAKELIDIYILVIWLTSIYISPIHMGFIIFWIGVVYFLFRSRNDFSSPLGLFVLIYALYSSSFPGHIIINEKPESLENVKYSLFLHSLGLFFFVCVIKARSFLNPIEIKNRFIIGVKEPNIYQKWALALASLGIFFTIILSLNSGATTKRELADSKDFAIILANYCVIFFSVWYLVYAIQKYSTKNKIVKSSFCVLILFLIIYMVTGERDIVFRLLLFYLIFRYDIEKKSNFFHYVLILILVFTVLPLSQTYKAIFLSESIVVHELSLEKIFVGEFLSSGRNLFTILNNHQPNFSSGEVIVNDIFRFFGVTIDGVAVNSIGAWYNMEYLPTAGIQKNSGWGFSWIGFWYLANKELGVVIGMSVLALCLDELYRNRFDSIYKYCLYLILLSVAMYTQRGDLANFLGNSIKFGVIPLVFYIILGKVTYKNERNENII